MRIPSIASYTRFVKSTKMLLGIFIVALISLIVFYPIMQKNAGLRIALNGNEKAKPAPTKMLIANFHGLDEKNQPYTISAKTTTQIDQNTVIFKHINSDIAMNNGSWMNLQANKGNFKVQEKLLDLEGDVDIVNEQGYELKTDTLHIEINKKIATTDSIVHGQGVAGTIKSKGAVFDGNAKISTFHGPVFVTVYLPAKEPAE